MGKNDFTKIPNGIPSLEDRINLLYTYGVKTGKIDLHTFVNLRQHAGCKDCSTCFRARAQSSPAPMLTSSFLIRIIAAKSPRKPTI